MSLDELSLASETLGIRIGLDIILGASRRACFDVEAEKAEKYKEFLEKNGYRVTKTETMPDGRKLICVERGG